MELHPVCQLFRELTPDEYGMLKDSIARVGVRVPAVTYQGLLVDGRHRMRACRELGIQCPVQDITLKPGESLVEVVAAMNVPRRHYSQSELAMVGNAIRMMLVEQGVPNKDAKAQAAQSVGVDESYVRRAATVAEHRPDLAAQVQAGELSLTKAHAIVSEELEKSGVERAKVYDKAGRELTLPKHVDAFSSAKDMDAIFYEFSTLKTNLLRVKDYPCNKRVGMAQVIKIVDDARKALQACQPYAVCVYCGVGKPSCEECGGFGWMTKKAWDLAPPEMKGGAS